MIPDSNYPFPSEAPDGVDRTQPEPALLSRHSYFLAISFWTILAIVPSGIMLQLSESWNLTQWSMPFAGFYFGACTVAAIGGAALSFKSHSTAAAAGSLAIVACAIGLMIGPVLGAYGTTSVLQAFALTLLLASIFGFVGVRLPKDLSAVGKWLVGALVLLLVMEIMGSFGHLVEGIMTTITWVTLFFFGGLTSLFMNRGVQLPLTQTSAIGVSVTVFVSLANILIRATAVMG